MNVSLFICLRKACFPARVLHSREQKRERERESRPLSKHHGDRLNQLRVRYHCCSRGHHWLCQSRELAVFGHGGGLWQSDGGGGLPDQQGPQECHLVPGHISHADWHYGLQVHLFRKIHASWPCGNSKSADGDAVWVQHVCSEICGCPQRLTV